MNAILSDLTRPRKVRLRVEDFMLLNDSGAFADHSKSELIDGEVYVLNAQHSRHSRVQSRLLTLLANRLAAMGSDLEALVEASVRLSDHSVPEPDIVLTTWRGEGIVPLETVALIIEVSGTSLDFDLGRKSDLYAAAGVAEYWVVDLNEQRFLMHEQPSPDGYLGQLDMLFGDVAHSATIEGLEIVTTSLLDPT